MKLDKMYGTSDYVFFAILGLVPQLRLFITMITVIPFWLSKGYERLYNPVVTNFQEIELGNGVLRGLDSIYRRSVAMTKKEKQIRILDMMVGFSNLKVSNLNKVIRKRYAHGLIIN